MSSGTETRRQVLRRLGWTTFWAIVASWGAALARFFFPRVTQGGSLKFKAGFPEEYRVGEVSTRFQARERVWIVRTPRGFYALLARCTHLGCTPVWDAGAEKFKCPCHGSGFTREGINIEGPAPRPLERVRIVLAPDGQLLVDKSVLYRQERGEWRRPGAFLRYASGQGTSL